MVLMGLKFICDCKYTIDFFLSNKFPSQGKRKKLLQLLPEILIGLYYF